MAAAQVAARTEIMVMRAKLAAHCPLGNPGTNCDNLRHDTHSVQDQVSDAKVGRIGSQYQWPMLKLP